MKPEYLQQKVEELLHDKEQLNMKAVENELRMASLERSICSLHDEIVTLKNRRPDNTISDKERTEILNAIGDETGRLISGHADRLVKQCHRVISANLDDFKKQEAAFVNHAVNDISEQLRVLKDGYNRLAMKTNKMIDVIDQDSDRLEKEPMLMTEKNMVRKLQKMGYGDRERCMTAIKKGCDPA